MKKKIAILLTVFNRKETTLFCLNSLFKQKIKSNVNFEVFLVDDGSTDGTSNEISIKFPDVNLIKSDGNLFWNGGMRLAWENAIAKEKYDFLHFNNKKFELSELKDISKILQLLRNESHRFAISQHRKRRSKNLLTSSLDEISGVGIKLHSNLLRHFGSKDKIMEASLDDLKSIPGIGSVRAQEIHAALNRK